MVRIAVLLMVAGCGGGQAGMVDAAANLLGNGSFDHGPHGWTGVRAALVIEEGRLRVTTDGGTGPGLAYHMVRLGPGGRYRLSAVFGEASSAASPQVRIGQGVDFTDGAVLLRDDDAKVFTATDDMYYVTLNNAGPTMGDYAVFDDVVLEPAF